MEHLDPGELKINRWGTLDDGTTFTRRVRPGQTLFGKRRAYQRKAAYTEIDAICSGDILVFEPDSTQMLAEFLPFLVQSSGFYDHALGTSAGSLSPRTNWHDLASYEFNLPPLEDQKRLAHLLWAVERERQSSSALGSALDRVRQALRDDIFDQLEAEPVPFESACLVPSQNGLALKKQSRAGDVPMISMGEMFRGESIFEGPGLERVSLGNENFLLRPSDLLFARRSIVFEGAGMCCLVPTLSEDHTFESSVIRSTPNPEVADSEFLLHYFRSRRGRETIAQIVRRGPVSGISGSDLRKLKVPVPSLTCQEAINHRIRAVGSVDHLSVSRLESARRLRDALSEAIFEGAR